MLAGASDLTTEDAWGRTPLVAAGVGGYVEVIRTLLHHLEKPDLIATFLSAVENGHHDVVSFLLNIGCPVNGVDSLDNLGPHIASSKKERSSRRVPLLLLMGASPGLLGPDCSQPVHLAALSGSLDVARLLVDAGAPLDNQDYSRQSPLISAIFNEHPDIVRLLLERGAV